MPRPKDDFEELYPCDFYTPEDLLDENLTYTVPEIARLLQGFETDAELNDGIEDVLLDWTIPWIMRNSEQLVIAEPTKDDEPSYFGLKNSIYGDTGVSVSNKMKNISTVSIRTNKYGELIQDN